MRRLLTLVVVSILLVPSVSYADIMLELRLTAAGSPSYSDSLSFSPPTGSFSADVFGPVLSDPLTPNLGSFIVGDGTAASLLWDGETLRLHLHLDIENLGALANFLMEATVTGLPGELLQNPWIMTSEIGGFNYGSSPLTLVAGYDPANGAHSFPPGTTQSQSFTGSPYEGTIVGQVNGTDSDFSISQRIEITGVDTLETVGFDSENNFVHAPEPTSVLFWTLASAFGVCAYRRKKLTAA